MRELLKRQGAVFDMDATCARDTEVVVLPKAALDALPPRGHAALLRRELRRATKKGGAPKEHARVTLASVDATTLCVLPTTARARGDARRLADALASTDGFCEDVLDCAALGFKRHRRRKFADGGPSGTCVVLDAAGAARTFGDEAIGEATGDLSELRSAVAAWTADAEASFARVLLVADETATLWSRVAVASADAVLVVALQGDASGARGKAERALLWPIEDGAQKMVHPTGALPRQVLAIVHDEGFGETWPLPTHTNRFLKERPSLDDPGHLHLRLSRSRGQFLAGDVRRLARFVAGKAVGVVLGGGGAKGLGHLGALRAFRRLGVEIDVVCGCSQGAMIGALVSREAGWPAAGLWGKDDDEEAPLATTVAKTATFCDLLSDVVTVVRDYNALSTSLSYFGGGAFAGGVLRTVGDFAIEDAWLPFFCVSTDVRTCDVRIHASGDHAPRAVLASMSLVGWFPPVYDGGSLLVDGGYAANMPARQLRDAFVGDRATVVGRAGKG